MISSPPYRNPVSLVGATLLFAVLGNTSAAAATPVGKPSGPSPAYEYRTVVDRMVNEGRVVAPPSEPEEDSSISVKAPRAVSEDNSGLHLSRTGLGALYWALGHPAGAWKVVFPVQPEKVG